jgi:uncharacterized protein (DUF58 family)
VVATESLTPDRLLRRLEWRVLRRLDGRLQGNYRTLVRGQGSDFRDIREYEDGDDVRHIDWNVTARMNDLFVRQYSEDRELTAWLLLDRSPSMGFGPLERTKEHVLAELAATIGQLLVRNGNKIAAIIYDNDAERLLPPRQGRDQILLLLRALLAPVQGYGSVTDLGRLLRTAASVIRRRSLVIVISDFITEPGWERPLLQLTERHEVVAVRLLDPREFELPDAGLLVVQDAETGEQLVVDTSDRELRRRLRAAADQREDEIRAITQRAGVDLHVISTGDDMVAAFIKMIESQRHRRR